MGCGQDNGVANFQRNVKFLSPLNRLGIEVIRSTFRGVGCDMCVRGYTETLFDPLLQIPSDARGRSKSPHHTRTLWRIRSFFAGAASLRIALTMLAIPSRPSL